MSTKSTIWTRSLGLALALGLATYGVFYMFFRIHSELGVQPSSAVWIGVPAFALTAIISLIYFGMKSVK